MDIRTALITRNAAANAAADLIDTSSTETITAGDIKVGDVLTTLGKVTFPHPVVIARATRIDKHGIIHLVATNGWFTAKPCRLTETATRVAKG